MQQQAAQEQGAHEHKVRLTRARRRRPAQNSLNDRFAGTGHDIDELKADLGSFVAALS